MERHLLCIRRSGSCQRDATLPHTSTCGPREGKPKVTFGLNMGGQPGPEIEEVLAARAEIAERGKRKVVIVFDEVQQVLEYESDMVERR